MNNTHFRLLVFAALVAGLTIVGCDKETDPVSPGGSGLFKSAGTFSFSSNRGNFAANGIFDTLMTSQSAAGAFSYSDGNMEYVVVFAYDVTNPMAPKLVYTGMIDTATAVGAGTYSYSAVNAQRMGFFAYFPNLADTASLPQFYMLLNGASVVSSASETNISGTFSGSGYNIFDTLTTIQVSSGSFNAPVVDRYFVYGGMDDELVSRIKSDIHRRFSTH
ncbi:MAG: hypothetical protein F9K22_06205 [Bacteroidetes bacterium]|nr:MAG: hypothetical protein F9K22_06205 [Bacteroidota bacterium]